MINKEDLDIKIAKTILKCRYIQKGEKNVSTFQKIWQMIYKEKSLNYVDLNGILKYPIVIKLSFKAYIFLL